MAESKDQAYSIVYVSEERPDKSNLAIVRAVNKTSSLWARDAREALALFDLHPPRNVYYVLAVGPASVDRAGWIDITDEERKRVASGSMLLK